MTSSAPATPPARPSRSSPIDQPTETETPVSRTDFAIAALSLAAVIQVVILIRGEESAGWAIAGLVLLVAAVASLARNRSAN